MLPAEDEKHDTEGPDTAVPEPTRATTKHRGGEGSQRGRGREGRTRPERTDQRAQRTQDGSEPGRSELRIAAREPQGGPKASGPLREARAKRQADPARARRPPPQIPERTERSGESGGTTFRGPEGVPRTSSEGHKRGATAPRPEQAALRTIWFGTSRNLFALA
jgi:hypothetical protein